MTSSLHSGETIPWELEPTTSMPTDTDMRDTTSHNLGLSCHPSNSVSKSVTPDIKSEEAPEVEVCPGIMQRVNVRRSQLKLQEKRRSAIRSREVSMLLADGTTVAQSSTSPSLGTRKKQLKDMVLKAASMSSIDSTNTICRDSKTETRDPSMLGEEYAGSDGLLALDPLEHEWMLAVAGGDFEVLSEFLTLDPTLISKKDFLTGLTSLHWVAKHGNHEVLIQLMKLAETQGLPVNVNMKGSGGHTPLHIAAMQGHHMVIKVLVGAFNADVTIRDNSGFMAWQYLPADAPEELQELVGAMDEARNFGYFNKNNNSNVQGCEFAPWPGSALATRGGPFHMARLDQVDAAVLTSNRQSWTKYFRSKLLKSLQVIKMISDTIFES
ncbi:ankyrin repeat domain-containing protein SOWAHD [Protopterus annectens]|uniref:ankyrin repeat domain-containing protein SOWAHD n=1 Tax=Protopterus annectens TaxID=7888 RepID=UPI001CF997CB|nr:ankyrin repeat domain-containing protein SOWAHD [Protopterus annectens]